MICCICEKEFDEYEEVRIGDQVFQTRGGHNPAPVKEEGRCCSECNFSVVVPARVEEFIKERTPNGKS